MKTPETKNTVVESSQQIGTSSNETPEQPKAIQKVKVKNVQQENELVRFAIEQKADVVILEKLLDLQMRAEANEARKAYVAALSQFRAKCPVIDKNRTVEFNQTRYKFSGLSETVEVIKTLEAECGLDHSWRTGQTDKGGIIVTCRVTHIGGHFEETSLSGPPDTSGSKNSIQAIGSTVSYLERYTLFALLGLASQDMDNDGNGNGGPKEPASQQRLIDMLIGDACKQYRVKKQNLLSADSQIDLGKFTEELRVQYRSLPDEQKKGFAWTKESIETLAGKIDVNKVVVKKDIANGARAKR